MTRAVVLALKVLLATAAGFGVASAQEKLAQKYQPKEGQEGKDAVWVPTPQALVDRMLDLAKITHKDYLIDLGSGDGRIVISAAKRGAKALGVEYNPDLVELSKRAAAQAGVSGRAKFVKEDLFNTDLSQAQVISMFLLSTLQRRLRPKLLGLKPGTRIVANTFDLGDWQPKQTITLPRCDAWCKAYLWIVPGNVHGVWKLADGELRITQSYQFITGTMKTGTSLNVIHGELDAEQISFRAGAKTYTGRVTGNRINGTVSGKRWSATKLDK